MKRIAIISILAALAASANAQTVFDALKYGENHYYGSARSIGLGNAVTALGGDSGSIGINPAGSAVNSYSQITLTGNLSFASSSGRYFESAGNTDYTLTNSHREDFSIPNFGGVFYFDTHRKRGLKGASIGFVMNGTSDYSGSIEASGLNRHSSLAGAVAASATNNRMSASQFDNSNFDAYYGTAFPWMDIAGYKSGLISTYGGKDNEYVGVTEKVIPTGDGDVIQTGGPLEQYFGRQTYGSKYDFVMNAGFNFSDRFYLGASLGLVSFNYRYDQYIKEVASDINDFVLEFDNGDGTTRTDNFNNLRYQYNLHSSGTGMYGKIGFIAVPVTGLRLGAAIQTPTAVTINDYWQHASRVRFNNSATEEYSPRGEYQYGFTSPFRANFGIAYTFGKSGLFSIDYELADYSGMRFREINTSDDSAYRTVNDDIKKNLGVSHLLRVGTEFKPLPQFALRTGYNLTTLPEDSQKQRNAFSFGFGYSSNGSFFADFALRRHWLTDEFIYMYDNYLSDKNSPEIQATKSALWDCVATIGFRF